MSFRPLIASPRPTRETRVREVFEQSSHLDPSESCATITLRELYVPADTYTGGELSLPEPGESDLFADSFAFERGCIDLGGQIDPNQPLDFDPPTLYGQTARQLGLGGATRSGATSRSALRRRDRIRR